MQKYMGKKHNKPMQLLLTSALLVTVCLLAGCSKEGASSVQSNPESATSTSVASQPETPSQPEPVAGKMPEEGVNALTGEKGGDFHRRPVAVMLCDSQKAFPQWGISGADILIEALTEGTDPWAMAVVSSNNDIEKIGPVGPARDLFLQFAMPYASVLSFIGADAYASNLLNLHAYQPLDGKYIGTIVYNLDYERDTTMPQELCWHTKGSMIQDGLDTYGQSATIDTPLFFNFVENSQPDNKNGYQLNIRYSESCVVRLVYSDQGYKLYRNDESVKDGNSEDARVFFDNVILLVAKSGIKDDGVTRDYDLSSGEGLYLSGGGVQNIQWQKGDPQSALRLFDADGSELAVQPGTSYIGVWGGFEGQALYLESAAGESLAVPQAPQAAE